MADAGSAVSGDAQHASAAYSRLTSIRQEREQLRSLIELAEQERVLTTTIKSLNSLTTVGNHEVSSLADSVRARLDEDDTRLELATRNVSSEIEDAVPRWRDQTARLENVAVACSAVPAMAVMVEAPIGRLDYHSSGVMLLSNDGELANFLLSRKSQIPRTYHVKLEGHPKPEDLKKLERGIVLDGRRTAPCNIRLVQTREKPWYAITLVEGRYHQVRRMFERTGQRVVKLKRVSFAFLTDRGLAPGQFRLLSAPEIDRLKNWKPPETAS